MAHARMQKADEPESFQCQNSSASAVSRDVPILPGQKVVNRRGVATPIQGDGQGVLDTTHNRFSLPLEAAVAAIGSSLRRPYPTTAVASISTFSPSASNSLTTTVARTG
jgi:hypothetical protein